MAIKLIGAGLPRTGTMSLKGALQRLTGEPCYHMDEVFRRPEHPAIWSRVLDGEIGHLDELLDGFTCAIDWPMSSVWREAAEHYPDALVLLSRRTDAGTWWRSADKTVWHVMRSFQPDEPDDWWDMNARLQRRFAHDWDDPATAMATYDAHLAEVRATIAPDRLVEYQPGDGWAPLCAALGVDEPDEPFPHVNSTEEFTARMNGDTT